MIVSRLKLNLFMRSVWHAVLGILAEIVFVSAVMLTGLAVCMLWWGLFR